MFMVTGPQSGKLGGGGPDSARLDLLHGCACQRKQAEQQQGRVLGAQPLVITSQLDGRLERWREGWKSVRV